MPNITSQRTYKQLFDSGLNSSLPSGDKTSEALSSLRQEVQAHTDAKAKESYLDRAISTSTEFWHKSDETNSQVVGLSTKINDALDRGDTASAERLAGTASTVVNADRVAMQTESTINQYGTGMAKTVGLFVPGKVGYLLTGVTYAGDNIKPGDSLQNQTIDGLLGVGKGLALKGSLDGIGRLNIGIAAKGVSLGMASRFTDLALTPQTYKDSNGEASIGAGAEKTLAGTFSQGSIVSDVVTFGAAQGILGRINGATEGALNSSPFWSTVTTGGVFGVASGSAQEIARQSNAHEKFDLSKVFTSAMLTGATDMVAAAPGAGMMNMRAASAVERPVPVEQSAPVSDRTAAQTISRNFAGSTSREFKLVDTSLDVAGHLRSSKDNYIYAPVQEIHPSGKLGPQQNLLVQHLGDSTPLIQPLAAKADLLAACNTVNLPESISGKRVLSSNQQSLWLTQLDGGRLRFSLKPQSADATGTSPSVELRDQDRVRSVTELLKDPDTANRMRDPRKDIVGIADAMKHFKTPAIRFIDGGADSLVMELADRSILKITDKPWQPEWGTREMWTPKGYEPFDARIIGKPQTIELPHGSGEATYYRQERARTPVKIGDVRPFADMIGAKGHYDFWDNDNKEWGASQLGYAARPDGKSKLVLLDYDAVRPPHLVPDGETTSAGSWWMNRYFADMKRYR